MTDMLAGASVRGECGKLQGVSERQMTNGDIG